ncbi:MAG: M20/M25/M40 family metallo-hydrolase [Gammaproteobacteria bacterium]|nr:MAG: M20/M25/M40 family metallo-hydrolase [Gammaproteobacteria bacterium]
MKILAISLSAVVLAIVAIVLVRTLLHTPVDMPAVEPQAINIDEAAIAEHLAEAIRFRTVSHQRSEEFQADQFEGFIAWADATYPEVHQTMELSRHGDYTLLYRWQGSDPGLQPILLTAHYDVVPVIPGSETDWRHPPFAGVIDEDVIWGRGALDDKSAVIAQFEAATHLLRAGFTPQRTIYFSFGHDEEVGGSQGAGSVTSHLAAEGVQLAWSLDEGSFLLQGMLPGVEPLLAAINVAEKGSVTLQVVALSAGGHSSMPPKQTAVGILAEAITKLENNPVPGGLSGLSAQMFDTASRYMSFGYRMLFANQWLFGAILEDQLSSVNFSNAMLRTTTAPTMLAGSVKVNVLPIEAIATVNFRIHPRDTVASIVEHVRSVVESENVEVRWPAGSGRAASAVSSWEAPGFAVIERALREVYGEVVVTPGLMIAGSDSRHYGKVADNAYRFNPMVVSQDDITGFHGTNEKIGVQNLAQGVRTYVRILALGGTRSAD